MLFKVGTGRKESVKQKKTSITYNSQSYSSNEEESELYEEPESEDIRRRRRKVFFK